jgi:hypothetical protein
VPIIELEQGWQRELDDYRERCRAVLLYE